MGGDKKPSARYFERGGHGKTVIAEATLTEEAVRRVLKTSARGPGRAGVRRDARRGRLRDAVGRLHARDRDRRALHRDRPGHRHGRDELDGPRDGAPGRRRPARLDAPREPRGGDRRRRHHPPLRPLLAPAHGLRRAGQGVPAGADRHGGDACRSRSPPRRRWRPPARRTSTAPTSSAAACASALSLRGTAAPRPGVLGLRRQPAAACACHSRRRRESSATKQS